MSRNSTRVLAGLMAAATLLTACTTGTDATTSTSGAPVTTTPVSTTQASPSTTTIPNLAGHVVYFLLEEVDADRGPFLVPVYREGPGTESDLIDALGHLLAGPSIEETGGTPSISTSVPDGTEIHGVTVSDGVAAVDLSGEYDDGGGSFSMSARLAQVVFTLTAMPDVEAVSFLLDGEPVEVFSSEGIVLDRPQTREDFYDLLPPIFVDSPAWGQPVTSPIEVNGFSNVFEATSQLMLTDDDGEPLYENFVTATCGTGCWGEWSAEISYDLDREQMGALIVWEFSAEDGSRINIREYPVLLRQDSMDS